MTADTEADIASDIEAVTQAAVAAEVRVLAQRSAAAAKDIAVLAAESRDKVGRGAAEVESAGRTIAKIVASFDKLRAVMAEIAGASREQGHGIEQVNTTITQL